MDVLKIFLLGFSLYYFITIADLLIQLISSYVSVWITKCNVKITELAGDEIKQDDTYRVGFHMPDEYYEEYDDDDYYED